MTQGIYSWNKNMKELFDSIDLDHNGVISSEELQAAMKKLNLPEGDATHPVTFLDDKSELTWTEFQTQSVPKYENLRLLFSKIDKNKDNSITFDEMRYVLRETYPKMSDTVAKQIFDKYDINHNGEISFTEWTNVLFFLPHVKEINDLFTTYQDVIGQLNLQDETPLQILKMNKKEQSWFDFGKVLLAGALSGAASKTGTAPLERIKVLKQVNANYAKISSVTVAKELYAKEGLTGLFRGNFVHVLKSSPEKSINFALYEQSKKILASMHEGDITSTDCAIAGGFSGGLSTAMLHPMDVIKTQLNSTDMTVGQVLKNLVQEGSANSSLFRSISPFFKGVGANLAGTVPSAGVNLATYEFLKSMIYGLHPIVQPNILPIMGIGAMSAMVSSGLFYPLTLIKSRIIMKKKEQTLGGLVGEIMKTQGIKGFFKGFTVSVVKTIPANAISFGVYELSKNLFGLNQVKK
jgi:solute carrier family 25 phosphate transporter 23/24/25/41